MYIITLHVIYYYRILLTIKGLWKWLYVRCLIRMLSATGLSSISPAPKLGLSQ